MKGELPEFCIKKSVVFRATDLKRQEKIIRKVEKGSVTLTLSGFASSLNPFIASRHLGFEISRSASSVIHVIVILFVRVISVIIGVNL